MEDGNEWISVTSIHLLHTVRLIAITAINKTVRVDM